MNSLVPPTTPDPLAAAILLLAALVLVPLGLRLIGDSGRGKWASCCLWLAGWLQLPCAVLLAGSFAFGQGMIAAGLAMPWFLVTLLVAAAGALDLLRNGWRLDAKTAFCAALLYVPVGGGWAVISRAGMRPQDFSHEIVLLTAVHFHYAGFVLPILAGLTVKPLALDRIMLVAIILGVPLVGVGISLSTHIEVAAAMLLTCGCVLLTVRQIQVLVVSQEAAHATLLCVSSLALVSAMGLAAVYAVGEFTDEHWVDISTMIQTHGAANALGFATCGLLAWCSRTRKSSGT